MGLSFCYDNNYYVPNCVITLSSPMEFIQPVEESLTCIFLYYLPMFLVNFVVRCALCVHFSQVTTCTKETRRTQRSFKCQSFYIIYPHHWASQAASYLFSFFKIFIDPHNSFLHIVFFIALKNFHQLLNFLVFFVTIPCIPLHHNKR